MYEIESGVEIPTSAAKGQQLGSKYPFAQMQVGQSFAVNSNDDTDILLARLRGAVFRYVKQQAGTVRFTVRATPTGVRVWRTA